MCQIIIIIQCKNLIKKKDYEIATIAHDLKTPVSAIYKILNMLQSGDFGTLNKEQSEIVKLSYNTSKYMLNLINTISSGYEYDYHKPKFNKTIFNITETINIVCYQNEYLAREKSQRIIFNTNNLQCNIYADKLQIERVIYNLLSNAIKYGFNDSDIILKLNSDKDYVNFSITNTGYPISDKQMKNSFKKFRKIGNSKHNLQSNGLGLYISKKIIDMHNGKIYAHASQEGIYTFGFKLKAIKINNPEKQQINV